MQSYHLNLFAAWLRGVAVILLVAAANSAHAGEQEPSETIRRYEAKIKYYRYYKPDSAIYFADLALKHAVSTNDRAGRALILIQQGMIDDNEGDFDSAQVNYQEALDIYQQLGSSKGIATATIRLGVVSLRNGNYHTAIERFLESLKKAEASRDTFGMMESYYSISWAYLDQKENEQALQYLTMAEALDKTLPFSNLSLNIYNHFGVLYTRFGKLAPAKEYLLKGVQQSNKPEYQGLHITLINNLAIVYSKEGHVEKAVALQENALGQARAMKNYLRELQVLSGLAKTYGDIDPPKAIAYMNEAITIARQNKAHRQEMRYLEHIVKLYKNTGRYKEALAMKEREHAVADSFYYGSMTQRINELKAEYELTKSRARIEELNYISHKRDLELENSNLEKRVTWIGVALLLVILGLLYSQYRMKQRANVEAGERNRVLQRLVTEKEWLLREVHHRVKNNLQTVVSLLETQSAYLRDDALVAIQNSQNRVYAMSLIHQKLYQTENVASINMAAYLPELVHHLRDSYNGRQRVQFRLQIDSLELNVGQSVPVALILNEAITNSIKYAFPVSDSATNTIMIDMKAGAGNQVHLVIADNGTGLPADFHNTHTTTLGLRLMKGLTEDLNGNFDIRSDNGTVIAISFVAVTQLYDAAQYTETEPIAQHG